MVSRRVRRRRRQVATAAVVLVLIIVLLLSIGGGPAKKATTSTSTTVHARAGSPLASDWRGSGKPVTVAFGGDVHFEAVLASRLSNDPATALDGTVANLMSGSQVSMANFDSALTNGTCPTPQPKTYVWYAPPTAITAFTGASLSLVTEANSHGEDCGMAGLTMAIAAANAANFPVIGIGASADQAYAPYRKTVNGQRISILAATQLFDPGLEATWSATASQPGVASALDQSALIAAVQAARKTSDTVIVYLNWGTETKTCPNSAQKPLAAALVKAGADIVLGSGAHVQQGAGYMGQALVDYGLGNLAFYDSAPPETFSGTLLVTVTGRHVDSFVWRPALIADGLPQPLTGAGATSAIGRWDGLRSCTSLSATPAKSIATVKTQTAVTASHAPTTSGPVHSTTSHSTTSHSTTTKG